MNDFVIPLSDPNATLQNVGGKGMSLTKLLRAGLPVPDGFHVTTEAYSRFVLANRLQPRILDALAGAENAPLAALEAVSQRIADLFSAAHMPDEIADPISRAYARLKDAPVAVRSSATAEDLPGASFAGQQETYLNVRGRAALLESVQRCWASLWTARAISYRFKNGIEQTTVALAVVVQKLVVADAAGVMFTANPMNGRRDEIVINAAWGLGEAVVSGAVTPDTATVAKRSLRPLQRVIATKQVMTVRSDGGTSEQPVPDRKQKAPVLSARQLSQLARKGIEIEKLYQMPMDIEWALERGKFAILQARPITTLAGARTGGAVEWKLPDPKGLYMRASIIEQLPEPLTPLFATLGGEIIDAATRRLIDWMIGGGKIKMRMFETINGYGYLSGHWGLANTARVAIGQMLKLNAIFKQSEPRWREARGHYLSVIQFWQSRPTQDYKAVELLDGVRALTGETMQLYTVLQVGPIATALGSETMFSQVYNRLIKRKGDPQAPVFLMGFESAPIRAEQALYDLAQWARSRPDLAAHLRDTASAGIAAELEQAAAPAGLDGAEWDEWKARFREHLACYGHFTYDLDFSKAVPADAPAPLLEACRMYLNGQAPDPAARVRALAARRQDATQAVLGRLRGPMRRIFQSQLASAQKYAPLREDGLSDLGLGYPLIRRMLREFGDRLARGGWLAHWEDVFWLNEQEADEAAAALDQGRPIASVRAAVEERRAAWKAEQSLSAPMVLPAGSKYMGMDIEKLTSGGPADDPNVIRGFGASHGTVTAPARVLLGPQDFGQMGAGDVLVAPITTPAWTPLFALASAIVTDIGGPLSHSSIVAREYGIPAVLGTGSATRRIRSGQTVTVDGDAGTVHC